MLLLYAAYSPRLTLRLRAFSRKTQFLIAFFHKHRRPYAQYCATSRGQKAMCGNSPVHKIMHLIPIKLARNCLGNYATTGPRGSKARARGLKYSHEGQGDLLNFDFDACFCFQKCILYRTGEFLRDVLEVSHDFCVVILRDPKISKFVFRIWM